MNQEQPPPYSDNGKAYGTIQPTPVYPVQGQVPYQQIDGQTTTLVMPQSVYPVIQRFQETPLRINCQFCRAEVITSTSYYVGTMAWVACFLVAWIFPLGCCFIPFCLNSCKDVIHCCPNCEREVGRFNRM